MKDSKSVMDLAKQAMPSSSKPGTQSASKKQEGGFKLYHMLLMAVLGLIIGAYMSMTFINTKG